MSAEGAASPAYVYVMVREDIPVAQQLVQSNHAALEAGFRFAAPKDVAHLVMLSVPDQESLLQAAAHLEDCGVAHHVFYEPDDDMGYSALATRPLFGCERKALRRYPLYRARS